MNTTLLFINDYNESCVCSYYKKKSKDVYNSRNKKKITRLGYFFL